LTISASACRAFGLSKGGCRKFGLRPPEGLIGFTRSLARAEGAAGIRVNCVVPGSILTEQHFEEGGKVELGRLAALQSLQRRGYPDDIAAACQFLASRAADFITGQVLTVDGGWSNY
jgi:NAD(P)-dependent dehydrogenase (short-subunit alcohol dehydrogenase family)